MTQNATWLQTFSGKQFVPLAPTPEMICIEDIAHGLSNLCRYSGQCREFYCPTPDQRILTSDLRWIPAGDLKTGDGLLSFDAEAVVPGAAGKNRRRYRPGRVTEIRMVKRRVIRLEMADGRTIKSSAEHPWLVATKVSRNQSWMTAEKIKEQLDLGRVRYMHNFIEPWEELKTRDAGWLAGIYDGEGYISFENRGGIQAGVSQKSGIVLDKICELIKQFGFGGTRFNSTGGDRTVITMQLLGGWRALARLLGSLRPLRLLNKFTKALETGVFAKELRSDGNISEVVAAYAEGNEWVVGMGTDTHTYLCEGYAAHNSVSQHSIMASHVITTLDGFLLLSADQRKTMQLVALMHDASEAYMVDLPTMIKQELPVYKEIEAKVMQAIADKFEMRAGHFYLPIIHEADMTMLATEKRDLMGPEPAPWIDMPKPYGGHIFPMEPKKAKQSFLDRFAELGGKA